MNTSDKLLSILGLFTIETPEWTVEAAAKHMGLGVSTTYRFFRSLSASGLIVAFTAGRYVLGPAIVQLDRQIRLLDPLIKTARPIMQRLASEIEVPGVLLLCRLYRDQVMCVHQEYSGNLDRVISYERGRLMPLHRGAASKAILAHMPARFVRAFHRDHADDMQAVSLGRDWNEVKQSLRRLRTADATVTHAELDPGVTGIAVPLFAPDGGVVGSLGFVLPDPDGRSQAVPALSDRLQTAGRTIGSALEVLAGLQSAQETVAGGRVPAPVPATPVPGRRSERPAAGQEKPRRPSASSRR
ncbi:helix-turn-helix domain-containing protein [Roseomonas sp. NAR14]|uniref:Helix-turn-helix domain-containing protein n=1 Tax=Roseomonas acroporae TaxID=2937791 RepID=A0A9X2BXL8_9PROT|nr:IclR family transcriptional regulator C-terminal domain-containing protein [Roseomonas acroporae]MCK8786089.1 helix-turn-helix domain-containing protein [Roseomonas acroporae]